MNRQTPCPNCGRVVNWLCHGITQIRPKESSMTEPAEKAGEQGARHRLGRIIYEAMGGTSWVGCSDKYRQEWQDAADKAVMAALASEAPAEAGSAPLAEPNGELLYEGPIAGLGKPLAAAITAALRHPAGLDSRPSSTEPLSSTGADAPSTGEQS